MDRGRGKLLVLLALFAAPLVAALLLYFVAPQWIPSTTTNYGTLVAPSRVAPAWNWVDGSGRNVTALGDKWSLVFLGAASCDAACEERLMFVRQVRKALDKESRRVQRVYIAPDRAAQAAAATQLAEQHHDLLIYADEGAAGARAVDFFKPSDPLAIYLVDPVGNFMMVYSDSQVKGGHLEHKGVYKDLKKLLRTSHIG